jgi:hypothetical protein
MSISSANLGLLLRIEPKQLEQQFWQSTDTMRMLCAMDMLGFLMVLPNVLVAMTGRVNKSLTEGVLLPEGAKIILLLYWVVAALPVAVMLWNFQAYRQHRTKLAIVSRAYRLVSLVRGTGHTFGLADGCRGRLPKQLSVSHGSQFVYHGPARRGGEDVTCMSEQSSYAETSTCCIQDILRYSIAI